MALPQIRRDALCPARITDIRRRRRRRITKHAIVAIATAAALLLGACSSEADENASGPVTIKMWAWYPAFQGVVDLFNKTHSDIRIEWTNAGTDGGAALFNVIVAGSLVAILPLIAAFLLLQRYWRGGLTMGALK